MDHHCPKPKDKTHRAQWVRSLRSLGLYPVCAVLEEGADPGYEDAERRWIVFYREQGIILTNGTDGGEGATNHVKSDELRKWLSESKKGIRRPPEVIERIRATKLLRGQTQKQINALRIVSEGNIGRKQPRHAVEMRAEMLRGKSWGTHGEKVRQLVSVRFKGIPKSPEQRAKMSAARRLWWERKRNAD